MKSDERLFKQTASEAAAVTIMEQARDLAGVVESEDAGTGEGEKGARRLEEGTGHVDERRIE